MSALFLDPCNGPACTLCGCRDSEVVEQPSTGILHRHGAVIDTVIPGLALCHHCGSKFNYYPKTGKEMPPRKHCPECGNLATAASSPAGLTRYKCSVCGFTFKTQRKSQ